MIGGDDPARRIFCAIDTDALPSALALAKALGGHIGGVKVGLELFTAAGPEGVKALGQAAPLFLDLKFHDIPNTVAGAVRAAVALRPAFLTLHVAGGEAMLRAARDAAEAAARNAGIERPRLLGVTVLTSLDQADLDAVGLAGPVEARTLALAELAKHAGLDGIVASAREAGSLRDHLGPDFKLVVPGLRPAFAKTGDQKRVATPAEALAAGADMLVIGRPITGAADPVAALQKIVEEINASP
ncbi:MAG: orotidine-5'-phosphate decarboxylase [Alphaproteobacteria bacterium]|nr:orotidine-5'-phosphate decarboxylase [Alphaproteobacteria bacterium]